MTRVRLNYGRPILLSCTWNVHNHTFFSSIEFFLFPFLLLRVCAAFSLVSVRAFDVCEKRAQHTSIMQSPYDESDHAVFAIAAAVSLFQSIAHVSNPEKHAAAKAKTTMRMRVYANGGCMTVTERYDTIRYEHTTCSWIWMVRMRTTKCNVRHDTTDKQKKLISWIVNEMRYWRRWAKQKSFCSLWVRARLTAKKSNNKKIRRARKYSQTGKKKTKCVDLLMLDSDKQIRLSSINDSMLFVPECSRSRSFCISLLCWSEEFYFHARIAKTLRGMKKKVKEEKREWGRGREKTFVSLQFGILSHKQKHELEDRRRTLVV